jgi:NAD(P)-dependent dehydrogenase (short-subunit alcohol dehydrogenase family)
MGYLEDRAGLAGKVVVVTGGAGGLGWPLSRDLAQAGCHVAMCDRDADAVAAVGDELASFGVPSLATVADVREPDQMEDFFSQIDERFGRVDALVNVPGGGFVAPFTDTNAKGWNAILRENLIYVFDTTQRAVERMRAQGTGGSIVYITSVEAHRAVPNRAVYGACKAGVANLAMTLALELADDGIRVNSLAPDIFPTEGAIDTPRRLLEARMVIPMARFGDGEDLSGCLLFLVSDLASYVSGTTLHVDGGTLASSGWFNLPEAGYTNQMPDWIVDGARARDFRPYGRPIA